MAEAARHRDFFVSYTAADRAWAEWVAWQLEQAGHPVIVQAWDFEPGDNFPTRMRDALEQADRTLALVSAAYLASPYCTDEWTGAFLHDPDGHNRLLLVRIEDCELPRLLRSQVYIDLVGLSREQARARLLAEVRRGRRKPSVEPPFPLRVGPRFPGYGPEVTNLPRRNPDFSGRTALLEELHRTLKNGGATAVVQAATVHGLGGVGKTQLVLEYAHRYASDYDVIWWVPAEQPLAMPGLLAGLARRLGVPEQADQIELLASLWDELRNRDRWLLVYDNADRPQDLRPYRPPAGRGRLVITSRTPTWDRGTARVRLDVLVREEAVAFLRHRTGTADVVTLAALAEALGDLPLALEQAAAYMDQTHTSPAGYLALYRKHGAELLALGELLTTEQTVATTWQVALERIRTTAGAQELLTLLAFLAADDIPRDLPFDHRWVLPEPLDRTLESQLAYNQALATLSRYALATVTPDTLNVHRLVQAMVRATLSIDAKKQWARVAVRLILAAFPSNSDDVQSWPTCARLLPHVLATTDHACALKVAARATAPLLDWAGDYLRATAEFRQARQLFERSLALFQAELGPSDPEVAKSLNHLGIVLRHLGELPVARDAHQRALAINEARLGPNHPNTAYTLNNLGNALRQLGELPAAQAAFQRALAIYEARLGPNHPNTASSLNNLGNVLRDLGDLYAARDAFQRALAIHEAQPGPTYARVAASLNNLGNVLRDLGDLAAARDAFEHALGIHEAKFGPDHPNTAYSLSNLGMVLRDLGELGEARTAQERALAIREARFSGDHPAIATSLENLGLVLFDLGELNEARTAHERALAIREARWGPDNPASRRSRENLNAIMLRRQSSIDG